MSVTDGTGGGGTDSPAVRLQTLFEGHRLTPTQRRIAHSMVRRASRSRSCPAWSWPSWPGSASRP